MEVVITRPSLIYFPKVRGNLACLIKLVIKGLSLPPRGIYRHFLATLNKLVD